MRTPRLAALLALVVLLSVVGCRLKAKKLEEYSGTSLFSKMDMATHELASISVPAGKADILLVTTEVHGTLDREGIRRVMRYHINEVKYCYESKLARSAALGEIRIQFTIGRTGSVSAVTVKSATLNDPSVEQCIVETLRRWQFLHRLAKGARQLERVDVD